MNTYLTDSELIAAITTSPWEIAQSDNAVPEFVEDEISAAFEMIVEPVTTRYHASDKGGST